MNSASPLPNPVALKNKKTSLRPGTPPDYDGDRTTGKAFLTSCRTYIRLCLEAFENKNQQIMWAMSFMKSGRANHWAEHIFMQEDAKGLPFMDWMDFESAFQRNFTLLNSDSAAINKLEGNSYFQKEQSVDDYVDEFRDLIHKSGYTDPRNIMVK